ncbi:MAG: AIPR family protein [Patescibacteria group bacterium]|nr:AIPR family protein [Patescibacteria group bacterium]
MNIYQTLLQAKLEELKPVLTDEFGRLGLREEQKKDSYTFLIFSMMSICDIGLNEAILCSTEGGDDLKIDGLYVDTSKSGDLQVYIFQSKYRTNLSRGIGKNEIDATINSIKKILSGEIPKNRINKKIQAKIEDLQDAIKEFGVIPYINVYFVTNGQLPEERDKEEIEIFTEKENRKVYFYSTEEILRYVEKIQKKDCKVSIVAKGDIATQDLKKVKSFVATISASELLKIYNEAGRDNVLEKNIRYYFGDNKINKEIKATAESKEDAPYFWFFNNGVSIICDYLEAEGDASGNQVILLENPTIVNGGQTTKTLFELSKKNSLFQDTIEKVFLLARIYQTKNEELIKKITEGTNRQNPIYVRDIKANDKVQGAVKEYFKVKGIYLETKRNEYKENISPDKIVKNDTIMQAYLSLYKNIPHQAKSSKNGVFEKYFNNIFIQENTDLPKEFFRSYELLKFTQTKEMQADLAGQNAFLPHASFAIIYTMGRVNREIKNVSGDISQNSLESAYAKAIEIINKSIEDERAILDDAYSHNKFFKGQNLISLINKHLRKS